MEELFFWKIFCKTRERTPLLALIAEISLKAVHIFLLEENALK